MSARSEIGTLEASGLISLAAMQPELEYLFRHVLVQDAAYGSLLKQERRELHRRVAAALQELYPERQGELAGVIGMHLAEAGDAAAAAPFFVEAGDQAAARYANPEARVFYERAAAALPADATEDEARRLRVRAVLGAVKVAFSYTERESELARLAELVPVAEALGDAKLTLEVHFWNAFLRRSVGAKPKDDAELRRSLDRLKQLGAERGDTAAQALPQAILGATLIFSGRIREGAEMLERSVRPIAEAGDRLAAALLLDALVIGYSWLGDFAAAQRHAEHAQRLAEQGDPIARLDAATARAMLASQRGDLDASLQLAAQCASDAESLGATACAVPAYFVVGDGRLRQGDAARARPEFERAVQLSGVEDLSPLVTLVHAGLAAANAQLGDIPAATRDWRESLETARAMGYRMGEAAILARRATALAREPAPDWAAVIADFEAAIAITEQLETRPALARALRGYASALRHVGRDADAEAAERRAKAIASEIGLLDRDLAD